MGNECTSFFFSKEKKKNIENSFVSSDYYDSESDKNKNKNSISFQNFSFIMNELTPKKFSKAKINSFNKINLMQSPDNNQTIIKEINTKMLMDAKNCIEIKYFEKMYIEEGLQFEGNWENGKKLKGLLFWDNGMIYEGEFKNDLFHGKGKLLYLNGDFYEGNWENNKANGKK